MNTLELLAVNLSLRVLVIEDDPEDFMLLSRMMLKFSELKTEAVRAASFGEGLEMLKQAHFDVAVADFRLGDRDGLEFIGEARALGFRNPIILLTGQGKTDVDLEALRVGAADYLDKTALNAPLLERSLRYSLERHRAQEALRRSDEYYRAVIDNSQDLITIIDDKAIIRFESPSVQQILGYGHGERLGRDLFEFLHPKDAEDARRRLDLAVRQKEGHGEGEYRMCHKDGSWRHMEFKVKNLLQLSGLNGVIFTSRDVTERKRGVETMLKVERLAFLGQLTAGMAHEVRNPLAIIQMSAEMLLDLDEASADGKRHATVIIEQSQRLLKLMTETLNYSKNRPGELSEAEPGELMRHSLKLARVQYGTAHEKIEVQWLPSPEGRSLVIDRQKAELVLVNLILNAFQAMPGGGQLRLGWLAAGDGYQFLIEDTGPGMSEADLDRIFDPFFTTKQQGSGLGLWLCQRMLDAAGGRMGVQSGLGEGSRFTVWLPMNGEANENTGR